jgi:hypothetical protein
VKAADKKAAELMGAFNAVCGPADLNNVVPHSKPVRGGTEHVLLVTAPTREEAIAAATKEHRNPRNLTSAMQAVTPAGCSFVIRFTTAAKRKASA